MLDWGGTTIKGILSNPHYTGHLVQGRTTTVSVVSTKRKVKKHDEYIVVENKHEALISRDVFEIAQKLMKERKKDMVAPKKHLFTNVTYCADCGRGMWYRSGGKYICGSYGRYGNERCSSHSIKEMELSNAIIQDFKTFLSALNFGGLLKHFHGNIEKTVQNRLKGLRKVEGKIKLLEKRKINYFQMRADGNMSAEEYKVVIERDNAELADLQEQIDTLSESATNLEFDLNCTQNDFMNYLFTTEVLPELIHRFISRIDIEADGTAQIQYSFKEPSLRLA
ncbi:recombinase family protein [Paenibacillus sp. TAF43_2]|uniref:recombinase family protein n=1 Tax=Paenibacillus sp. TAF43_2 TaxID=3233069 RepID=UPI003F94CD14